MEPRVAYRGIPPEDMPVSVAVQPFPTERFGHNVEAVVGSLTDGDLAGAVSRHHPADPRAHPAMAAGTARSGPLARHETPTAGVLPTGPSGAAPGGVAGQVTQATGAMTGALMRALAPLSPVPGPRP